MDRISRAPAVGDDLAYAGAILGDSSADRPGFVKPAKRLRATDSLEAMVLLKIVENTGLTCTSGYAMMVYERSE